MPIAARPALFGLVHSARQAPVAFLCGLAIAGYGLWSLLAEPSPPPEPAPVAFASSPRDEPPARDWPDLFSEPRAIEAPQVIDAPQPVLPQLRLRGLAATPEPQDAESAPAWALIEIDGEAQLLQLGVLTGQSQSGVTVELIAVEDQSVTLWIEGEEIDLSFEDTPQLAPLRSHLQAAELQALRRHPDASGAPDHIPDDALLDFGQSYMPDTAPAP